MRVALVVFALLVVAVIGVLAVARASWRSHTAAVIAKLNRSAKPSPGAYAASRLDSLPAPVARYLRLVLREGQPLASRAALGQRGTFLVNEKSDGWGEFTGIETFVAQPAGFVWDARIRMAPGMDAWVRDAFADGAGSMEVSMLALVPVTSVKGTREISEGALHRWLAEAVWMPAALLPGRGVTWAAVDDTTARATVASGGVTVSLDYRFGPDGLVSFVYAESRMRDVHGRGVPTPWLGRFGRYAERGGMRIPLEGAVGWVLPEGWQPYWRGEILEAAYEPAAR
jgi:hypothetical protein